MGRFLLPLNIQGNCINLHDLFRRTALNYQSFNFWQPYSIIQCRQFLAVPDPRHADHKL